MGIKPLSFIGLGWSDLKCAEPFASCYDLQTPRFDFIEEEIGRLPFDFEATS